MINKNSFSTIFSICLERHRGYCKREIEILHSLILISFKIIRRNKVEVLIAFLYAITIRNNDNVKWLASLEKRYLLNAHRIFSFVLKILIR